MSLLADISAAKEVLHEVAVHAHNLAMGLQNAAPHQAQEVGPVKTIQYLLETAIQLEKTSQALAELAAEVEDKHGK